MKTIKEQWDEIEATVINKDAGPKQRKEMRNMFYAGAHIMLCATWDIGADDISMMDGARRLEEYHQEIMEYVDQIILENASDPAANH